MRNFTLVLFYSYLWVYFTARMPKGRMNSYCRSELREKLPHIAEALEKLFNEHPDKFYAARKNYNHRATKPDKHRRLTLGWIIETLENYGYSVTISLEAPHISPSSSS